MEEVKSTSNKNRKPPVTEDLHHHHRGAPEGVTEIEERRMTSGSIPKTPTVTDTTRSPPTGR